MEFGGKIRSAQLRWKVLDRWVLFPENIGICAKCKDLFHSNYLSECSTIANIPQRYCYFWEIIVEYLLHFALPIVKPLIN